MNFNHLTSHKMRALAASCAVAAFMVSSTAHAMNTDVTIGMQLEPPNLDPTGGAAAAIDDVRERSR